MKYFVILLILLSGCNSVTPATVAQLNEVRVIVKKSAVLSAELASQVAPQTPIAYKMDIHAGEITETSPPSIFNQIGDAGIGAIILALTGGVGKVAHLQHKKKVALAGNQHPDEFNKA